MTFVQTLELPYEAIRTLYNGPSEVRLYRNEITGVRYVGKRIDLFGLEETVTAMEHDLLLQIDHPNVIRINDVADVVPGAPPPMHLVEMTMPYFKDGSIADALERGDTFSIREGCRIAVAMLRGLSELHEVHRILHRDFKSGNVLLSGDQSLAKVGDLGIAVLMDDTGQANAYPNATLYTPPETYTIGRIGRTGDIYGASLVFHELTSGRMPWEEYTVAEVAQRLDQGRPAPWPRHLKVKPHVAPRLRSIVRKGTSVDPESRFQTANEMVTALNQAYYIDWTPNIDDDGNPQWEGGIPIRPDVPYRVRARVMRSGLWRLRGERRVTAWRRCVDDVDVPSLDHREVTRFFDDILENASRS